MKLYDGMGPNPQVVRMFIAEKGIEGIDRVHVDITKMENRQDAHLKRNPSGQLPVLENDKGEFITEVPVICEYLEELYPEKSLLGSTAEERAETRSWLRKLDLALCEPMENGFRFGEGIEFFKERFACFPETSDALKAIAANGVKFLNSRLEGRTFICGDRFSLADIFVFCMIDFFGKVGQPVADENSNVKQWLVEIKQRPSTKV